MSKIKLLISLAASLLLVGLVFHYSFAAAIAPTWPSAALRLAPYQSIALLNQAQHLRERYLYIARQSVEPGSSRLVEASRVSGSTSPKSQQTPEAGESIESLRSRLQEKLTRVLSADPINAVATRTLGEVEEESTRSQDLMVMAARQSKREAVAVFWIMDHAFRSKLYSDVIDRISVLLSIAPGSWPYVYGYLERLATVPAGRLVLEQAITEYPSWRLRFLQDLPRRSSDPALTFRLLSSLKNMGHQPKSEEISPYIWSLVRVRNYGFAYFAWLNLIEQRAFEKVSLLNNKGFEVESDGSPFDWSFSASRNASAEFVRLSSAKALEGSRVLQFRLGPGRVEFPQLSQYLKLPPGRYVLSGFYRSMLRSRRGLAWKAYCVDAEGKRQGLREGEFLKNKTLDWERFEFSFDVLSIEQCQLARLVLHHGARSASEKLIDGEVYFDKLSLGVPKK